MKLLKNQYEALFELIEVYQLVEIVYLTVQDSDVIMHLDWCFRAWHYGDVLLD